MFHPPFFDSLQLFSDNSALFLAQVAKESIEVVSAPSGIGFFILRLIFILIGLFFLGLVIYLLRNTNYLQFLVLWDLFEFLAYKPYGTKSMRKPWNKILQRLETGDESHYKLAIVEADDLVDAILKRMGYAGEDLGERLSHLSPAILPSIKEVEVAHQIRNHIVHDPDYRLTLDEARKTLEKYEAALRDLQALD